MPTDEDQPDTGIWRWTAPGMNIRASVKPVGLSGDHLQGNEQNRGEVPRGQRVMIYTGKTPLETGMGVLHESADGLPNYRISGVEPWGEHQRAWLELIPTNRRSSPSFI
jgi:hypothetical protein